MTRIGSASRLLPLALLAGCAVGPDFKTPPAPPAERVSAQPLVDKTVATPVDAGEAQTFISNKPVSAQWWTLFGSDKLNGLIDEALKASPSVTSAQAALRVAQENYRAQASTLFPTFDGSFSGTRQKIDTASFGNPGGGATIYNIYKASVDVSYGIDLWGGTRRGVEASRATAEAQAYELEATYQTLIANIITSAVTEAAQRTLLQGQYIVVADQEKLLKVTQHQFDAGAISRSDLLSAESNLATERSKLPGFQLAVTQAQNQLAVYLGKTPSEFAVSNFDLSELKIPQEIPVSLPSELVRQRPDIRAAEAQLHEASANVGVATANLLPQIALTASIGTQASVLDQLFTGNIFSIGGTITQPIFHAGELTAKRRAAIASLDKAAADYKLTVLTAFQNVADTLRALETDADYLQAQYIAADSAGRSLKLAELQYRLGGTSYLSLLNAQQTYTKARAGYISAQATRLTDTAALFQALGGGWTQRDPKVPFPPESASAPVPAQVSTSH
jgi:NodT family efflux transporter outer membrane factor (OMF) lipoprotein